MHSKVALTLRTVRHLRPAQVAWRLYRKVQRFVPSRAPTVVPALRDLAAIRDASKPWMGVDPGCDTEAHARKFAGGEFEALGLVKQLEGLDWTIRHHNHLWSYHLHYFDDTLPLLRLARTGSDDALKALIQRIDDWIRSTAGRRGDGWDPYPISIRSVHWMKLLILDEGELPATFRERLARSVFEQVHHLRARLEWDLQGNHLLKNLMALLWGGLLFEGREAQEWRTSGLRWLGSAYRDQVLDDGLHEERAASYHLIALQDLVQGIGILTAAGEPAVPELRSIAERMQRAAPALVRSDGSHHLFNDSPNGMGPSWSRVQDECRAVLGSPTEDHEVSNALESAGFWVGIANEARLVVDCGPIGPDHQPAHGHCDMLSFELEVAGKAVVVDSGVHGYDGDLFREYSRSTRAHSTVMIAGGEQSEVWGTFRVARRARAEAVAVQQGKEDFAFRGRCVPFHDRRSVHERRFNLGAGRLEVTDVVTGAEGAKLESFLHLAPFIEVAEMEETRVSAFGNGKKLLIEWSGVDAVQVVSGSLDPVQGWYFAGLGHAEPAPVLVATISANRGSPFGFTLRFDA